MKELDLTWLISVRLLDTAGRGGGLASSLGSKLLTGSLATSGLTYSQYVSNVFKKSEVVLWEATRRVVGEVRLNLRQQHHGRNIKYRRSRR